MAAALANEELRRAWAELVLGGEAAVLPAAGERRRRRALEALERAGLAARDAGGSLGASGAVFEELLAAEPSRAARGPERFLRADGRVDRYPADAEERRVLLEWIAARAFVAGEVLDERSVNERLSAYGDDVALLRRYLVDHGLLERTRSGGQYARLSG